MLQKNLVSDSRKFLLISQKYNFFTWDVSEKNQSVHYHYRIVVLWPSLLRFHMLLICTGAAVQVQLFRWQEVWVVSAAGVVSAQALPSLPRPLGEYAVCPAHNRTRVSQPYVWRHVWVLRLAFQLLLQAVLFCLCGHWLLLRLTGVSTLGFILYTRRCIRVSQPYVWCTVTMFWLQRMSKQFVSFF